MKGIINRRSQYAEYLNKQMWFYWMWLGCGNQKSLPTALFDIFSFNELICTIKFDQISIYGNSGNTAHTLFCNFFQIVSRFLTNANIFTWKLPTCRVGLPRDPHIWKDWRWTERTQKALPSAAETRRRKASLTRKPRNNVGGGNLRRYTFFSLKARTFF